MYVDKHAHHCTCCHTQISPLCLHGGLQVMDYTVIHICYAIFTCVRFRILILMCASCNIIYHAMKQTWTYPTWDLVTWIYWVNTIITIRPQMGPQMCTLLGHVWIRTWARQLWPGSRSSRSHSKIKRLRTTWARQCRPGTKQTGPYSSICNVL